MTDHVHTAERVGELMEFCACGAKRLNATWSIPDEARKWTEPPSLPENAQGNPVEGTDESDAQPLS